MSGDIFQIGTSGLQAAQLGIATTGQNISNASTPGYSEEVNQQEDGLEQAYSFGYVGTGTQVGTITREYNQLIASQINATQSSSSQITSYSNLITPIDNTIADSSAGLSPVLQSFFSSLQNLSANPSGVASLQTAMSGAQTLVTQFQTLQTQLTQTASTVNSQISSEVNTINTDAQQLAAVNQAIQIGYANANNQPPNSLLDQRDQLINSLSQETQVTVVPVGNQYNVFIGNGQPLVMGATANTLETVPSSTNPSNLDVAYIQNGVAQSISENSLPGGTLGGLFAFRTNTLSPVQNAIGQVAIVLGSSINAQNELGQTINGTMGKALFTIASPVINANSNNAGAETLSGTITNPGALTPDNYTLSYDGSDYTVTDTTTNAVKYQAATFPAGTVIDGVSYTLSGPMTSGDTFSMSPTADGVTGLALTTTDPTQIATAAPIATSAPSTNTGSAALTAGSVTTGFTPAADLASPVTLTYSAATDTLSGFPAVPVTVTTNGTSVTYPAGTPVPYVSGMSMSFNNMVVGISGTPADGDKYVIGSNTDATGDNRNVLLMSNLLTQNTMNNGTATFQGAYAQMVDAVGNTTSQLQTTGTTETNLLNAATQQQQSVSGVNLDQETVNLLQYQQVYEACGKLISVASQNFATVLALDGTS